MKNNDNKKITLTLIMLGVIISFFGGSLAYWSWQSNESEKTLVSVSVQGATLTIEGGNVEKTGMYPTNDCAGAGAMIGEVATATAVNGTATDMEVLLKIRASLSVSQGSLTTENKGKINWALVDTSDGTTCSTTTYKGTLADVTTNTDIDTGIRFTATKNATTTKSYRIYVWLDSTYTHTNSGDTISDPMQNLSISVKFSPASELSQTSSVYTESILNGTDPVLDTGMIPVTISNDGVATVADTSKEWYSYENKQWANAVLVKKDATEGTEGSYSREYYKNNPGTPVLESDILTYYVWIPSYKYKLWTNTTGSSPQTIDIVFVTGHIGGSLVTAIGSYRVHPAFIWDDKTISGIWVGKFEVTGDATTPTIKPNVSSLGNQNVSTQFTTSLKFAGGTLSNGNVTFAGSDTYGLVSSTDSHMMKNSEWGAVAYLSHSEYGINSEIRINNNKYYKTGCGASEENGSSTSQCQISYGSNVTSYPQSTTGNITGIFDMSGGALEYVMGWYSEANSNYVSDTSYFGWTSSSNDAGFTSQIASKYWDNYTSNDTNGCGGRICFGHALFETSGWYSDARNYFDESLPWLRRGGADGMGANAGVWNLQSLTGKANVAFSFRSVAIVGS